MADLISREAAIAEVEEYLQGLDSCISEPDIKLDGYRNGLEVAIYELEIAPTIDAIPVEWIMKWSNKRYRETQRDVSIVDVLEAWQKEQE